MEDLWSSRSDASKTFPCFWNFDRWGSGIFGMSSSLTMLCGCLSLSFHRRSLRIPLVQIGDLLLISVVECGATAGFNARCVGQGLAGSVSDAEFWDQDVFLVVVSEVRRLIFRDYFALINQLIEVSNGLHDLSDFLLLAHEFSLLLEGFLDHLILLSFPLVKASEFTLDQQHNSWVLLEIKFISTILVFNGDREEFS